MNKWSPGEGTGRKSRLTKNSSFKIGGKTDMSSGMTEEEEMELHRKNNPTWSERRNAEIEEEKKKREEMQKFIDEGGLDAMRGFKGFDPDMLKTPPPPTNEEKTRDFSMSKFEGHKGPQSVVVDPMANVNQQGEPIEPVEAEKDVIPPPGSPGRKAYYDSKGWKYDDTVPGYDSKGNKTTTDDKKAKIEGTKRQIDETREKLRAAYEKAKEAGDKGLMTKITNDLKRLSEKAREIVTKMTGGNVMGAGMSAAAMKKNKKY